MPPFQHVTIVGLGLIGGSLALALKRAWPQLVLHGVDKDAGLASARAAWDFSAAKSSAPGIPGTAA